MSRINSLAPPEASVVPAPVSLSLAARARTTADVLIAIVAVGFALYFLGPIVRPLLIAGFLFLLVNPLLIAMSRRGVPVWAASVALLCLLTVSVIIASQVVYDEVRRLEGELPDLRKQADSMAHTLVSMGVAPAPAPVTAPPPQPVPPPDAPESETPKPLENPKEGEKMLGLVFGSAVGFIEVLLMATFYLIFMFLEVDRLPGRVERAFPEERARKYAQIGRDIACNVTRYLGLKTWINLGLAATTAGICAAFGVRFWLLWGLLMFLANYVTYVGSIVLLVPPVALAFLTLPNPWLAGGLTVALILNRLAWIDYVEIRFLGRQLNISPLVLLLGIAFFGLLWGVPGMVLSVPLLTTVKIILAHFDNTKPIAVLISEE